jgi:hypothetical protein
MISRRFKRSLIALLLPLLVLRAMLPAGYMPVADAAGLRIVMCSAGLVVWSDAAAGTTAPHEAPASAGDCAFAQSPGGAPPVEFLALSHLPAWARQHSLPTTDSPFVSGDLPRAHRARGPPAAI